MKANRYGARPSQESQFLLYCNTVSFEAQALERFEMRDRDAVDVAREERRGDGEKRNGAGPSDGFHGTSGRSLSTATS